MKRIRRIMVACDMSEHAKQSLKYGAELAESLKAELIVVNVINQRDVVAVREAMAQMEIFSKGAGIRMDDYVEKVKKDRAQLIQKLLEEEVRDSVHVKKIVKIGFPFQKIIEAIREENADILVMGTQGRSNLSGLFFGSNAEKLFRHCPIPLLSIREKLP